MWTRQFRPAGKLTMPSEGYISRDTNAVCFELVNCDTLRRIADLWRRIVGFRVCRSVVVQAPPIADSSSPLLVRSTRPRP